MLALASAHADSEQELRKALAGARGAIRLPGGVLEISVPLEIPASARDLEIVGDPAGSLIRASNSFRGRALILSTGGERIRLRDFTIDGNRDALEMRIGLPPHDVTFARFYDNNAVLAEGVTGITISDIRFRNVAGFAILASRARGVRIARVRIVDSGSRNERGRNNTSGGILLEEGTSDFEVRDSVIERVRGNGIWTHSNYTSPRNENGRITGNRFADLARDAIQVGHATNVRVERNNGKRIGFPEADVDVEGGGTPVGIDTAGNVDRSVYAYNRFEEINGKCIDLDGFHDGEVRGNTCINRLVASAYAFGHFAIVMNNANPDMRSENIVVAENMIEGTKFGGIFVIGRGHRIIGNRLRNLNTAGCTENAARFGCYFREDEPDMLRSGIYLGRGAERPDIASGNTITENVISGHKMRSRCIAAAPGVSLKANRIERNHCADSGPKP